MRPDDPPHGAQSAPWGPRHSGATSAERGPHRACCARWGAIPGVFERGATQPAGMQRRPNAAGVSPRAAKGAGMRRLVSGIVVLGMSILAASAAAQTAPAPPAQPPPMTNLQIYPKDTPRPELVATMQGFAQALG